MGSTLIVITGPTASGKSALAVALAKKLETEIISADSRQIYKGIPIVTAVPSLEEKEGIKHHLLESLELTDYYSASKFKEDAESLLPTIFQNSDTAIVCGGSMLYIDALVNGIDELPTVPEEIRSGLMEEWKSKGDDWLLAELKKLDPIYYENVDLKNLKRVFHAVELSVTASAPYSSLLTGYKKQSPESNPLFSKIIKVALSGEREKLFDRINKRVIKMIENGLEEEAQNVYSQRHLNSLNTVGLKEMFSYFEGTLKFDEAISRIQKNTRVYAKKQLTWHNRDPKIKWLDFSNPMKQNVESIINMINH